jgi:hypothetical protein
MRRAPFLLWLTLAVGLALAPLPVGGPPSTPARVDSSRLLDHEHPLPGAAMATRLGAPSAALLPSPAATPAATVLSSVDETRTGHAGFSPLSLRSYFPTGPPGRN